MLLYSNNIVGAPSTTIVRRNTELWFDPSLKWHVDIEYYIRQISANANIVYSPELLVVTFLPEGRVSDECKGNKNIEVFEYFYLLDKIAAHGKSYTSKAFKTCILRTIAVCKEFKIKSVRDIRNCGYKGYINLNVSTWLLLNSFSFSLGKLYLKFLRNI